MSISTSRPMCSKVSNQTMSGDAEVAVEVALGVAAKLADGTAVVVADIAQPIVQLLLGKSA